MNENMNLIPSIEEIVCNVFKITSEELTIFLSML